MICNFNCFLGITISWCKCTPLIFIYKIFTKHVFSSVIRVVIQWLDYDTYNYDYDT